MILAVVQVYNICVITKHYFSRVSIQVEYLANKVRSVPLFLVGFHECYANHFPTCWCGITFLIQPLELNLYLAVYEAC